MCLGAHYRSKLNFTWKALEASQNALDNLYNQVREKKIEARPLSKLQRSDLCQDYREKFFGYINDDLNTPKALALMWEVIKDKKLNNKDKKEILLDFDKVFGLNLAQVKKIEIPEKIKKLAEKREEYRKKGDFKRADEIRKKIKEGGYWVEDTQEGSKIKKL